MPTPSGNGGGGLPAKGNDNVLDDNKLDFNLLTRRRHRLASRQSPSASRSLGSILPNDGTCSQSSSISEQVNTNNEMIWPLHLTPTFVDHYVIGEIIGHGSYAEVRECVDMRSLERFAMKIIDKKSLARQAPQALSNQLQEIRLLRNFRHDNIIAMIECLSKGNIVYIILEYCSFNLDELLNDQVDGKFHVSIGRRFFHQLCLAVHYLHSLGVVHRDIKPQNMLLTNAGQLKLIDFGVSHVLSMWDRNDMCNNYEGSPLFQSPEIVLGGREYSGFKADVWSCGVTLFRILYGQYPFMDEALLGLYDKILADDFVVPECPPTSIVLTDLFALMLERDCSRRADIKQVLEHPWMQLLDATTEHDEMEHSEFFDLVIKRHNDQQKWSQIHATFQLKDMYKSMTVLPYLYRHHFPHLPIRNFRRSSADSSSQKVIITRINSLTATSGGRATNQPTINENIPSTTPSPADSGPHEIVDEDSREIEWGTREQYHLMKVPQIRANRIRCGASTKFKEKQKHEKKRHRKDY